MFYKFVTRPGTDIKAIQWNKWIDNPKDPYEYRVQIQTRNLLTKIAVRFLSEAERQSIGKDKAKYGLPRGWIARQDDGYFESSH